MFRQIRNHFEFLKYNQADPIFQNVLEILKMTAKLEKRGTSTTPSCGGPLRAQMSPVASFHMPAPQYGKK